MANPNVILQWNCDGLQGKRTEIEILITKYCPAVICLQETKLSHNIELLQQQNKPLPSFLNFKDTKDILNVLNQVVME